MERNPVGPCCCSQLACTHATLRHAAHLALHRGCRAVEAAPPAKVPAGDPRVCVRSQAQAGQAASTAPPAIERPASQREGGRDDGHDLDGWASATRGLTGCPTAVPPPLPGHLECQKLREHTCCTAAIFTPARRSADT